ncbi:toprim domain-containing protein [Aquimarina algiphila]|uniref:Toprim domain-containing protein n=1 Tax=Aquimarina algiphila TaxID=2047982 RepID=A0A554VBR8_9FLAO|nr:toprim domain-containing protein [Aquimarina algiphila]TSE04053.1 toprim domain-containing protein [Aquimarina algiphila]
MNIDILTKENILNKINLQDAFNHYLQTYHNRGVLKQGKHISNPFLAQKQKTPSFNIYEASSGNWRFKDFATADEGSIFDLVMRLKQCDFREALILINQDFSLKLSYETPKIDFEIQLKEAWQNKDLEYWQPYGINISILKHFNVHPIKDYTRVNTHGKRVSFNSSIENPMYGYKISGNCYKIYCPLSTRFRFAWLGDKPDTYIFGYTQLPKTGNRVFITGGEKDVLSLYARNEAAICFNSETANPPLKIIDNLKARFKEVIVLYDIDHTGITQSIKLSNNYGLQRMVLPEKVMSGKGKDIADFFALGHSLDNTEIISEAPESQHEVQLLSTKHIAQENDYIPLLLKTQKVLTEHKAKLIHKALPLLFQKDIGILYPRTINVIQGKAGVHKSRLAETICSALIKKDTCDSDLLSFRKNTQQNVNICYVDTERNLTEQFPYALQQILKKAGYQREDTPDDFDYISLLQVPRKDRFFALTSYIKRVKMMYTGHVIIILDVITDCIQDFNRSGDSMQLIDLMNDSINSEDVTFLALIHENPGSTDKARGHLGTELLNKATTAIQIGFEKDSHRRPTDLIILNILKLRGGKRPEPFYMRYCERVNGLVEADADFIDESARSRRTKADLFEIQQQISRLLRSAIQSRTLVDELASFFDCSERTIRERLQECIDKRIPIANGKGIPSVLQKKKEGKEVFYSLAPIKRGQKQNTLQL